MELAVREPLDGRDATTRGLHREHQARADRPPVQLHGARSADAVLAADARAMEARLMADEVRQQRAWLDFAGVDRSVDLELHPHDARLMASSTSERRSARFQGSVTTSSICSGEPITTGRGPTPIRPMRVSPGD